MPAGNAPAVIDLATTDKVNDLEPIAVVQQHLRKGRSRHDLEVALDGDLGDIERQIAEQRRDRRSGGHAAQFAIQSQADHRRYMVRQVKGRNQPIPLRRSFPLLPFSSPPSFKEGSGVVSFLPFVAESHHQEPTPDPSRSREGSSKEGSGVRHPPLYTPRMSANLVLVLNGPNLNLLGSREPEIYGHDTLDTIANMLEDQATALGLEIDLRQSNHEGHLVDWLHEAGSRNCRAVILNAGALTHTSVALHDAVKAIRVPVIEVHLSNPHAREAFRHHSFISSVARGTICGFGAQSYALALDAAARLRQ